MKTAITDAAVEAAADAIISDGYPFELGLEHARAALEAALPHLAVFVQEPEQPVTEHPGFIACSPDPCAYQRRDAMPADTGGFSHWHEISRDFYMNLEHLQTESPWTVRGIELRKLYAPSINPGSERA
ncbi:hypothetical protein [Stenotrophomonas maltophilia]|uniref:hypothetical protein n=1 Tax=Stenotrophomonas maltophilia TaxID=40324 RepID=UPI0014521079|nr:hypothetical protein [Stenotrophomonas maltophilia]QJC75463.1 hypothetical protein HGN30_16425 [Stenotrophomonas maltophilia]